MPSKPATVPTRRPLPLILIRGFGGLGVEDEKKIAYQGFNDGTVYPQKRGENYIYEGFILRFLKSSWRYQDATNVVGYYGSKVTAEPEIPDELKGLDRKLFFGDKVVIDPAMALSLFRNVEDPCRTLWVFRYYDLDDREFKVYGKALVRLIDFIRALTLNKQGGEPKVNIIAHSMGGLLVREAVQRTYPGSNRRAEDFINKIVTLGTPHRGISFQILKNWIRIDAEAELNHFNPDFQAAEANPEAYVNFHRHFPLDRLLTIVGTNYRTYDVGVASALNRMASISGEFGPNYNRSDGLVKQTSAQIPGAPRAFVHKCHGGFDSLVTSRESFEIATRFFFGNVRVRLFLKEGRITRGKDMFGKSEFFFGVSLKPRRVDFELFHQSAEGENCYGPFNREDLKDGLTGKKGDKPPVFGWAGADLRRRMIWEGYLDTSSILRDESILTKDMVLRLDIYIGERDLFGVGFSDNLIFRKQYYLRALLQPPFTLFRHADERFADRAHFQPGPDDLVMQAADSGWEFPIGGPGFEGVFRIEIDDVPKDGHPTPRLPTPAEG
jgi:pimeloyl-ACP methyl ester carboxylesterase